MKKIFYVLFAFLVLQSSCFAQDGISFLYINGSNNNDLKMTNWYENGVKKLHPCMKKAFDNDAFVQKEFLENGKYKINEKPVIFFWGDRSHNDLSFVEKDLSISKRFSPWLAYQVRSMIMHFLHDAIWVEKYHNMLPILDDLHKDIVFQSSKGNKIVMFGYSAGSFVTYQYLLTRLPFVNVADFFAKVGTSAERMTFIKENPVDDTCITALGQDLAIFSAAGHVVPNDYNDEIFKRNYLDLNRMTKAFCTPNHSVKGIVNFASPLVLFYSDISDPDFEFTYYNKLLIKYLIENDMFWLTVNYREDPLGFPCGKNLSIEEIEDLAKMQIEPHAGFIYDQSNTYAWNYVFNAHTSYWATRKTFSKAVVRAYKHGYLNQYDDCYKKKTSKNHK